MAPTITSVGAIAARLATAADKLPNVAGLAYSSLELDKRSATPSSDAGISILDRATIPVSTFVPGAGTQAPGTFNNVAFLTLFCLIGAAMVVVAIWFFFWAKNGGFHFQSNDWDDYKSTVLRRKGPDGKTLSNATKSTKLGGSTIAGTQRAYGYAKWDKQAARSIVGRDEKGRKGILAKRGWAKTHSIMYSDDYMTETFGTQTVSDMTETRTEPDRDRDVEKGHGKRYRDRDVQQYKKEKPARVGGLNRVADGSHFGTTVASSDTMTEMSDAAPMLPKHSTRSPKTSAARERENADRTAREEAAKMERRWRREAEAAASALARENGPPPPPPAHKKSAAPSSSPAAQKQRRASRSASRSASPKKRDFSYQTGPASEVLSSAYTSTSGGTRTASYYDEYRPKAQENPRYSSEQGGRSRQSSPKKEARREGGYRRGADSDLD